MIVLSLENVPDRIRGECTKYLLEIKYGLYIGNISRVVKDLLWEMIKTEGCGEAVLICSMNNEQGFSFELFGNPSRSIRDFDGIKLFSYETNNQKDTKTLFKLKKSLK